MAHIEKYKAHSVGHMLAHYRRDPSSFERDNIDPTLTDRNLTLVLDDDGRASEGVARPNWETVAARIAAVDAAAAAAGKRRTRKDAVVMADLVLTLPKNVSECDGDRFFELSYEFFAAKVGRDNLMGGFVHRDEMRTKKDLDTGKMVRTGERVRDHMHVPWTPILDGRFNFKQQCPRAFYKTLHKELGDHLEAQLGYRPEVELSFEKKGEKALSQVQNADIDATRDAIQRQEERLECLRRDADELESLEAAGMVEVARTAASASAGGRIAELEREVREARARAGQLEREVERLGVGVRDAGSRLDRVRERVTQALGMLGWVPKGLSEVATSIGQALGLRVRSALEMRESLARDVSTGMYRQRVERGEVPRSAGNKKVI